MSIVDQAIALLLEADNPFSFPDNPEMDRWNLTKVDAPMLDNFLRNPEYAKKKGFVFKVEWMSPEQYFERLVGVFRYKYGQYTLMTLVTQPRIDKYAELMKQGEKFPALWIEMYKDKKEGGQQEGRHRAMAAIAAGIKWVPVVTFQRV